ncbi:enkurin-like [Vipera latastei]
MAEPCPQPPMEPQESIYHWLPAGEAEPAKPTLKYVSTFRPSVRREMDEARKAPCRTMGIPKLQLPTPKEYLRKHAKERKAPQGTFWGAAGSPPPGPSRREAEAVCSRAARRLTTFLASVVKRIAAVVARTSGSRGNPSNLYCLCSPTGPLMGIHSEKNFVTANVAEAIMAVAKKPLHACVDQRKGEKFLLDDSGLVQRFLKKKDFGVTPKYIQRRKKEAVDKTRLTRLSSRERESILEGLKDNWEEINKDFQSLSVEITTIPQRLRKEKLETEMKQLEHDIAALEKHKFIYVAGE